MRAATTIPQDPAGPRRLIVHIGVQKTGSTSLHDFLKVNRPALAGRLQVLTPLRGTPLRDLGRAAALFSIAAGIEPADADQNDTPADTALSAAPDAAALKQERETRLTDAIAALKAQIDAGTAAAPGTTCLVSHENLPGAMPGRAGTVTLYPCIDDILDRLDAGLAPYRPEYVIYTRDFAAWKRSVHNQAVRSDGYTADYAGFETETDLSDGWDGLAARLAAAAPGRAHVFRLEDEPDETRPGSQLLRLAGLSPDQIAALTPVTIRHNESLNAGSVEFLRRINAIDLRPKHRRMIADLIGRHQDLFTEHPAPADRPRPA